MSDTPQASAPQAAEPAATVGISPTPKDPEQLSVRLAEEAVRQVHTHDDVDPQAALDPHPDPKVPGANYVDIRDDPSAPRYWVGMAGEVLATEVADPSPGPNPALRQARTRYTAAVEAVRLAFTVPVSTELFATPDTFVAGAFFVHDRGAQPVVRWVDADGGVHAGYQLQQGEPQWDEATVAVRRDALASQPGTAALVNPSS